MHAYMLDFKTLYLTHIYATMDFLFFEEYN